MQAGEDAGRHQCLAQRLRPAVLDRVAVQDQLGEGPALKPETLSLACPLSVSDQNPDHWKQKEAEAREAEERKRRQQALLEKQVCV